MSIQGRINESKYSYKEVMNCIKYDLRQNILSCHLTPPLQSLSLTCLVIDLWQCDIRDDINRLYRLSSKGTQEYISIEIILDMLKEKVYYKASCLNIPFLLQNPVEKLIKIIKNEIKNYFYYEEMRCIDRKDMKIFIYHFDNLCWTEKGKINKIKTSEKVIENANLSTETKYILACNNCLVDKIKVLFKKLPNSFITKLLDDKFRDEDFKNGGSRLTLVFYWTFYCKGEIKSYDKILEDKDLCYKFLLQWAMNYNKEVAFQYIWEHLVDTTMKHEIIQKYKWEYNTSPGFNIWLYIYTQLNQQEFEDLKAAKTKIFLAEILYHVSLYYKVSLLPEYMHEFLKTNNNWDTLSLYRFCWNKSFLDLETYVSALKEFTNYFLKNQVNSLHFAMCSYILKNYQNEDLQTIKFLLRIGTVNNKINFLMSLYGLNFCIDLICKSLVNFEQFLNNIFDTKEEISLFKSLLLADPLFVRVFSNLSLENRFKEFDEILNTCCPMNEISEYKRKLPYKLNSGIIRSICCWSSVEEFLTKLDKFMSWCFEEDENKMNAFKARKFDLKLTSYSTITYMFFQQLNKAKRKNMWKLVEQYWKWIFFATECKIIDPKEKLLRIENVLYYRADNNFCEFPIDRFIISCFEQNEIDELKKELMDGNILLTFVEDIIDKTQLDSYLKAEHLLDWCYSSDKDGINKFKNNFLKILGLKILLKMIEVSNYEKSVEYLFEWLKPSAESAKLFKNNVIDYIKRKEFHNLTTLNLKTWTVQKKRLTESLKIINIIIEDKAIKK